MLFGTNRKKLSEEKTVLDKMLELRHLCYLIKGAHAVRVSQYDGYELLLNPNEVKRENKLWYVVYITGWYMYAYKDAFRVVMNDIQNGVINADGADEKYYDVIFEHKDDFRRFKELTHLQIVDIIGYLHQDPSDHFGEDVILSFPFIDSSPVMGYVHDTDKLLRVYEKETKI